MSAAVIALARHRWTISRWVDGRGGYAWRCACGVMDHGTAAENPERFERYPTPEMADLSAAAHVLASLPLPADDR